MTYFYVSAGQLSRASTNFVEHGIRGCHPGRFGPTAEMTATETAPLLLDGFPV
jgi:hypothetical protein